MRGLLVILAGLGTAANARQQSVTIDPGQKTSPFPHYWEEMMGSGRAVLSLRQSYRDDLKTVRQATDLGYVRFHGIFHDEVGVFGGLSHGLPWYNFQYVDQIYDGLLAAGVRPFVELSFMPRLLAAREDVHPFWYHPIVSPPKSDAAWADLIESFARHLVERYGIDEVAHWYFEVWNEPNADFWTGEPQQASYFHLYDVTARALKAVNPRLIVGGPSTAQAAWVAAFIAHVAAGNVPVDFISTHVYGNDDPVQVIGAPVPAPVDDLVCLAVRHVHDQIAASARPDLPLIISEFNATYDGRNPVFEQPEMAAWLAATVRSCDGLTRMMAYWTFSDVFEEGGVIPRPMWGGFGLIGLDGIPKQGFAGFALLHHLGDQRIPVAADNVLATRTEDGRIVLAAWNRHSTASDQTLDLDLALGTGLGSTASVYRIDESHANAAASFRLMGSPIYPSAAQIAELREAGMPGKPETVALSDGHLRVTLDGAGLVVIEVAPSTMLSHGPPPPLRVGGS